MNQWVDASIRRIEWYREKYAYSYKGYETGRQLMATALSEAEKLSPDLLDANTAAMRDDLLVSVPSSESFSASLSAVAITLRPRE